MDFLQEFQQNHSYFSQLHGGIFSWKGNKTSCGPSFRCFLSQEAEVSQLDEELQQNEALRKRLNEQVTQLQGQLAIEEQRSRFCTIL